MYIQSLLYLAALAACGAGFQLLCVQPGSAQPLYHPLGLMLPTRHSHILLPWWKSLAALQGEVRPVWGLL